LFAFHIANKYGFPWYDGLIVASAVENSCSLLITEDLQDGQVIENTLTIINPFKSALDIVKQTAK
jgi:predicted nucleic acid-binding protein